MLGWFFRGMITLLLRFRREKSGNKGMHVKNRRRNWSDNVDEKGNVPLGSQKWMPLLRWMILESESSNPRYASITTLKMVTEQMCS